MLAVIMKVGLLFHTNILSYLGYYYLPLSELLLLHFTRIEGKLVDRITTACAATA
jgi:hypothetical protein